MARDRDPGRGGVPKARRPMMAAGAVRCQCPAAPPQGRSKVDAHGHTPHPDPFGCRGQKEAVSKSRGLPRHDAVKDPGVSTQSLPRKGRGDRSFPAALEEGGRVAGGTDHGLASKRITSPDEGKGSFAEVVAASMSVHQRRDVVSRASWASNWVVAPPERFRTSSRRLPPAGS